MPVPLFRSFWSRSRALRRQAPAGEWFAVGPEGRYLAMEPLRPGGAAALYRGWDRERHRLVVLKLLEPGAAPDGWQVAHLRREGDAATALRHPALVELLDRGEEAGRPYLVYDFYHGGSLADAFRAGSLPFPAFARVVREVAGALAWMHARGWLHADVKPANVLFDDAGCPRLADLGLARPVGEPARVAGRVVLSAGYAPPEQEAGEPLGPPADVFALCAVLREGAEGSPWPGESAGAVPQALAAVLERGTRPEPAARFRDAGELAGVLDAVLRGPLPEFPAGRRGPAARETETRPRWRKAA